MGEMSNVTFSSNVAVLRSDSTLKLDEKFCNRITDYYALKKLYEICGCSTNSYKYRFTYKQIQILCPDIFTYGFTPRVEDEKIQKHNEEKNLEYGYDYYLKNGRNPLNSLIDEYELNYGSSVWSNKNWLATVSISQSRVSEKFGTYEKEVSQKGTVEPVGGGTRFSTFVKQELKRINADNTKVEYTSIDDADLPDMEKDPYYYLYQRTAGVEDPTDETQRKYLRVQAYLHKYGIYSAFKETEQETIINGDVSENIFVDAGPGTGKTYTLINKINSLVEQEVDPESVMVLCFTNAAVAEVKKRRNEYVKSGGDRGLRNVDIRTFHSFAWWLINFYNNDEYLQNKPEWRKINMGSLSFDSSIVKATGIIRRYGDYILDGWTHFIVDEIQDLTDVRARLVLELVKGCMKMGAGVTVLGDSCQAIYDYDQEEILNPLDSKKFYELLFTEFFDNGSFYKLAVNKRQTSELIELTREFRESILNEKVTAMRSAVSDIQNKVPVLDSIYNEKKLLSLAGEGKICLLCRNNAQVLRLSSELRKRDIAHVVNAYDHKNCYATWISAVFHAFDKATISLDEFVSRYRNYTGNNTDGEIIWNKIAYKLDKEDNVFLSVNEIIECIYSASVDDSLFHNNNNSDIIVSNIHRAKGREYEAVVVESNFVKRLASGNVRKDDIGEYKTLYVALTRPKKKLYFSNMVHSDGIRIIQVFSTGSKRWGKFLEGRINFLEVRETDIRRESFNKLSEDTQEYILKNVHIGDEIKLRKSKNSEILRYDILHCSNDQYRVIGEMNDLLNDDLYGLLKTNDPTLLPAFIENLYVTDVFTNISDNKELNVMDRVWSWVEFCGLGKLNYDVY